MSGSDSLVAVARALLWPLCVTIAQESVVFTGLLGSWGSSLEGLIFVVGAVVPTLIV